MRSAPKDGPRTDLLGLSPSVWRISGRNLWAEARGKQSCGAASSSRFSIASESMGGLPTEEGGVRRRLDYLVGEARASASFLR